MLNSTLDHTLDLTSIEILEHHQTNLKTKIHVIMAAIMSLLSAVSIEYWAEVCQQWDPPWAHHWLDQSTSPTTSFDDVRKFKFNLKFKLIGEWRKTNNSFEFWPSCYLTFGRLSWSRSATEHQLNTGRIPAVDWAVVTNDVNLMITTFQSCDLWETKNYHQYLKPRGELSSPHHLLTHTFLMTRKTGKLFSSRATSETSDGLELHKVW